jgi:hypothetical protein
VSAVFSRIFRGPGGHSFGLFRLVVNPRWGPGGRTVGFDVLIFVPILVSWGTVRDRWTDHLFKRLSGSSLKENEVDTRGTLGIVGESSTRARSLPFVLPLSPNSQRQSSAARYFLCWSRRVLVLKTTPSLYQSNRSSLYNFISLPRDRNHYVVSGAKPPPVFSGLIFEYRVNHK